MRKNWAENLTIARIVRSAFSRRIFLLASALAGITAFAPYGLQPLSHGSNAFAQSGVQQPMQDGQEDGEEIQPLNPGEAVVTRFSHLVDDVDSQGQPIKVIDINGVSASIIDIRRPGDLPSGQHWINEPQRLFVTAGEVGQVFGVTLADTDKGSPDIYLSATAAFGLHRSEAGQGGSDWMAGMWGPDAGPGSIYRISAENGFVAEKFADVKLDGRENTGASLGNLAYDKAHGLLFVSDLETGMIHSLDIETGEEVGVYDHGTEGRANFIDVRDGQQMGLDPIDFDPSTSANIDNCPSEFSKSPRCWNIADFRRRVWGLNVRNDENGGVRLFYSVWGSDPYGNPSWLRAGEDRLNSVWSIGLAEDGQFDVNSVRREFFMPEFWPAVPAMGPLGGLTNAVSDIAFPVCGPQRTMLVSEHGGMRNLGLDKIEPFARPYESRVVRYELGDDGVWRPAGRYDVGFYDRTTKEGEPLIFASAAGGADFGYGLGQDGIADMSAPGQSVWMTGDALCSPNGPCTSLTKGANSDTSEVHGVQGTPLDAIVAIKPDPQSGFDTLLQSYMIDTDINVDENNTPIDEELTRNDATKIGDIAIYQSCAPAPVPVYDEPVDEYVPPSEPPEDWPVHTLRLSHQKWASAGHQLQRSWHRRNGSWHNASRSWHWREGSWHSANRSWHRREGSWHDVNRSWHLKVRSYHSKNRTWGENHQKGRSFHVKGRTWNENHSRGRSYHQKGRSWGQDHSKNKSYHLKGRTWDNNKNPNHVRSRSYHVKGRTWGNNGKPLHIKGRTWANNGNPQHSRRRSLYDNDKPGNKPKHLRRQSLQNEGQPKHLKRQSQANQGNLPKEPKHLRRQSLQKDGEPKHLKRQSQAKQGNLPNEPKHLKRQSQAKQGNDAQPQHSKRQSRADNDKRVKSNNAQPQHSKRQSRADNDKKVKSNNAQPQHSKARSRADNDKRVKSNNAQPQHSKAQSRARQNNNNNNANRPAQQNLPKHRKKKSQLEQEG